jgi:DNA polymerase III alpha subunit (gram-positive type)
MIFLDIETTGTDPQRNTIASIGAYHPKSGKEFYAECYVSLRSEISKKALEINGFTLEQLSDTSKPAAGDVYRQLVDFCIRYDDFLLAGENIGSFDVQFLKSLAVRTNSVWPFKYRYVDLHTVSFLVFGESLSQDQVREKLGMGPEPKPHNALTGAKSAYNVYRALMLRL